MGMYSDLEHSHINDVAVQVDEEIKQKNRELCERFPFLIPRNRFSGKKITDCCGPNGEEGYWPGSPDEHPEYDFEYTVVSTGWFCLWCDECAGEILGLHVPLDEFYEPYEE